MQTFLSHLKKLSTLRVVESKDFRKCAAVVCAAQLFHWGAVTAQIGRDGLASQLHGLE